MQQLKVYGDPVICIVDEPSCQEFAAVVFRIIAKNNQVEEVILCAKHWQQFTDELFAGEMCRDFQRPKEWSA